MPEQPSTCLGGADIQRELDRFGITCAVVSSTAAYKDDLNAGNQETLDHLAQFDRMRGAPADEVAMFRRVDQLYPDTPVIIGHGHGLEGLDLARTCRNIHLELCTSYPEQNVYRRAIDAVGAERVLFGTDLEMISPAFVCGSIWEAGLSDAEARKVFRDNARRLLRLD